MYYYIYRCVCLGRGGLRGLLLFRLRLWLADASCICVFACACGLPTRAASPPLTYSMVGEWQLWGARTAIGGGITFSWWACERQLVDGELKSELRKATKEFIKRLSLEAKDITPRSVFVEPLLVWLIASAQDVVL